MKAKDWNKILPDVCQHCLQVIPDCEGAGMEQDILPGICDYCMKPNPYVNEILQDHPYIGTDVRLVRFRIGSGEKHKFILHPECIPGQVREICTLEL